MDPQDALLALHLVPTLGPVRGRRLIDAFGSAENVLRAPVSELEQVHGIGPHLAREIASALESGEWEKERERIVGHGAWFLTELDPVYPRLLRTLPNAPLGLFVRGELSGGDTHAVAVVGSRKTTPYGMETSKRMAFQIASAGWTVISGLARGIDTAAHQGALAAGGRTVAVIGSGLADLYPPENELLAERICASGAVVSEFPMRFPPNPQTFPYRNRIVAGWCQALLVVEAGLQSGALITANLAGEYGRSVLAVPGPIDRASSHGANRLIQQGAKLVQTVEDILDELEQLPLGATSDGGVSGSQPEDSKAMQSGPAVILSDVERQVLEVVTTEPSPLDRLVERLDLPVRAISAALIGLELKRCIRALPGQSFARIP
jgi:DNA processing protein